LQFEPHLALSAGRPGAPWIANYHDPFPISLYPVPYRHSTPLLSARQERLHRRIVREADALTFPSERLLRWVLNGSLEPHRRKAFVVPHIAGGVDDAAEGGRAPAPDGGLFTVVHTGTVLHQRNPQPLLGAFLDFVRRDSRRAGRAKLVFVGRVASNHAAYPEWGELERAGALDRHEERISYDRALDVTHGAAALVVLEADCAESPFYPAKLADYLWLKRPILALSPVNSATADVLGADYALLVPPLDRPAIAAALETLWDAWSSGRLAAFVPPAGCLERSGPAAVSRQLGRVLERTRRAGAGAPAPLAAQPLSTP
jgi:hypothetical protein